MDKKILEDQKMMKRELDKINKRIKKLANKKEK